MGEVYRALDTVKDRVVALKLLTPEFAADPGYQERFRRESQLAARLSEPHVIPIHDWGEIDGVLFIDMRLVEGQDLRAVLRENGALEPARAVRIVEQVAAALDAAHRDGLVHRDVKPENILLDRNDFAYLVDFGIAQADSTGHLTQMGLAIGSYAYMAPERFGDGDVGARSDVYSLACVLYEALTGSAPHRADTVGSAVRAVLLDTPTAPSAVNPVLPRPLDAVIDTGLAKDPAHRYPSASAFIGAAAAALGTGATGNSAPAVSLTKPGSEIPTTADPLARNESQQSAANKAWGDMPRDPHYSPTVISGPVGAGAPGSGGYGSGPYVSGPPPPPGSGPVPYGPAASGPVGYGPSPQPYQPMSPPPGRSGNRTVVGILVGLIVVFVVGLGVLAAVLFMRDRGGGDTARQEAVTVTADAPVTTTPAPTTTSMRRTPPAGSTPCAQVYGQTGAFSGSAVGNAITSCAFAEEVRLAYSRSGPPAQLPRSIPVYSPVTGSTYSMSCIDTGAVTTCTGGNDAVVYVY